MTPRPRLEQPWLSVAMPVHHGDRWLQDTLDSVAAQDCSGIEFIILDSSTGNACETIVAAYEGKLHLRYERTPHLLSWTAKTNLAVKRAIAHHVTMLHQDDLWLPNRASVLRELIGAFADAVMIISPSVIVDQRGRRLGLWRCPLKKHRHLQYTEIAERLIVQNFVAIPAPVIRRTAWNAVGGMDNSLWYTADWDLYLKLLRQGPVVYSGVSSTGFRVHGSSLTISGSRDGRDFRAQMRAVVERHIDLVPASQRSRIMKRAGASIAVNCELAEAAAGNVRALVHALGAVLHLGPLQAFCYLRDSRLMERAVPRLRAKLAGGL